MRHEKIHCKLCEQPIEDYQPVFHHFMIDERSAVDICSKCGKSLIVWQQEKLSKLFPTNLSKKRFKKE